MGWERYSQQALDKCHRDAVFPFSRLADILLLRLGQAVRTHFKDAAGAAAAAEKGDRNAILEGNPEGCKLVWVTHEESPI